MYSDYPKVLDRVKSNLIDALIIIGGIFLITEIVALFGTRPVWATIVIYILAWLYEPLCVAFGATIGNDKMNIRVRKFTDESQKINIFQALVRYIFKLLFGWLSFLTIFSNDKNRAIHDIVSGSIVVKANM